MSKIEIENKENMFWVLIGEKFAVYNDKQEAIGDLKKELKEDEDATIVELNYREYDESEEKDERGTFELNAISWKDIAMGWIE